MQQFIVSCVSLCFFSCWGQGGSTANELDYGDAQDMEKTLSASPHDRADR